MRLTEQFLKDALPGLALTYSILPDAISCSVDTRTLQPGDIFVALEGKQIDGHAFIEEALMRGAGGLLIATDKKELLEKIDTSMLAHKVIMIVPKPLTALIQLAYSWRSQFDYPVVGITGSVGKTSTKELLAHIMKTAGRSCLDSQGNQNTVVGASLNLLKMRKEHSCSIIEMGISKRGEMAELAALVRPTTGIITNVGHAHMEGLGAVADIAAEKRMLFSLFKDDNVGVVNGDQFLLANVAYRHPIIKFGSKTTNQIQARKTRVGANSTTFVLKVYGNKYTVTLPTTHLGMLTNTLASVAMAHYMGIDTAAIIEGIVCPPVVKGRYEMLALKNGSILIHDAYNANPENMKSSLLAFHAWQTPAKKIAVLGDMRELGSEAHFWHGQIGRFLRKTPSIKHVVLVGTMINLAKKGMPITVAIDHVATWQEAHSIVATLADENTAIFVKGSQAIGLTHLVNAMNIHETK